MRLVAIIVFALTPFIVATAAACSSELPYTDYAGNSSFISMVSLFRIPTGEPLFIYGSETKMPQLSIQVRSEADLNNLTKEDWVKLAPLANQSLDQARRDLSKGASIHMPSLQQAVVSYNNAVQCYMANAPSGKKDQKDTSQGSQKKGSSDDGCASNKQYQSLNLVRCSEKFFSGDKIYLTPFFQGTTGMVIRFSDNKTLGPYKNPSISPIQSSDQLYLLTSDEWNRARQMYRDIYQYNREQGRLGPTDTEELKIDDKNLSCFYNRAKQLEDLKASNCKVASSVPVSDSLPIIDTSLPGQCSPGVANANIPGNSVINAHNASVREDIRLVGVPFGLSYASDRLAKGSSYGANRAQIGGWSLTLAHFYDVKKKILYFGDGTVRNVESLPFAGGKTFYIASVSGSEAYIFNKDGSLQQTVNTNTGNMLFGFQYDEDGRIIQIIDGFGNKSKIMYSDQAVEIVSPGGQVHRLNIDSNVISSVILPSQAKFIMSYDKNARLTEFRKMTGEVSRFTYNADGNLLKDEGSGGNSLSIVSKFDKSTGKQTSSVTTKLGRVTTYVVSSVNGTTLNVATTSSGGVSKQSANSASSIVTDIYGSTYQKKYSDDPRFGAQSAFESSSAFKTPGGEINLVIDTKKNVTKSADNNVLKLMKDVTSVTFQKDVTRTFTTIYDALKFTYTSVSPLKRSFVVQSNQLSQVLSVQAVGVEQVNFAYASNGNLVDISQGERTQHFEYDQFGNVSKATDVNGLQTSYRYDLNNKLLEKTFADGQSLVFKYDAGGNITSIIPPGKESHNFVRNIFQLVSEYLPPAMGAKLSGSTKYSYNSDKQLVSVGLPNGSVIDWKYGESTGLLESVTSMAGITSIKYMPKTDLVSSITNGDGIALSYGYVGNFPTSIKTKGVVNSSAKITYNSDSSISQIDIAGADSSVMSKVSFGYDKDGLLAQAGTLKLGRNNLGNISSSVLGQVTESYAFNNYGEVNQQSVVVPSGVLFNSGISRDKVGRVSQIISQSSNGNSATLYRYDQVGRLLGAKQGDITRTYSYDSNGNRIGFSDGKIQIAAAYDEQDRLVKYGSVVFTYSDLGSLATRSDGQKTTSYSYDEFGNIKKVGLSDGKVIEYVVDGQNRRIGKKINGKLVQGFVYQNQLQVVGELDGTGRLVKTFIYGSKVNIPDYVVIGGNRYRVISNQVGTPTLIVDASNGDIVEQFDYDEFGNELNGKVSSIIPFGFAGGIYDQDTGLTRFGARDYDSEVGRWTAKDPIGFNGGQSNLYAYAGNDPVNYIDPDGRFGILAVGAVFAAVGGTFNLYSYIKSTPAEQRTFNGIATSFAIGATAGLVPLIGIAGGLPLTASAAAIWTAEISAVTSFGSVLAGTFVDLGLNAALLPANIPSNAEADVSNGIKAIQDCGKDK